MPREAGNGPRKPSRSPPPEQINAAGCCSETRGAVSGRAIKVGSMRCTADRGSISRTEEYRRVSKH